MARKATTQRQILRKPDPVLALAAAERKAAAAYMAVSDGDDEQLIHHVLRQRLRALRALAKATPTSLEGIERQFAIVAESVRIGDGHYDLELTRSIRRGLRAMIAAQSAEVRS